MDFYRIEAKETKKGLFEIYPDFSVDRSRDLMVRGSHFYAIWDEERGLWSQDEYDLRRMVDEDLKRVADQWTAEGKPSPVVRWMRSFKSKSWESYTKFLRHSPDNYQPLDSSVVFSNTPVAREDYASRKLPYALEAGDISAWDELLHTLYSPEERRKIEWAIGSVISGDSKKIQKFLVFYGSAGTGKSTVLRIIEWLFDGYTVNFDAKALGNSNSTFAADVFKSNALVGIQHDGDLSRIEDNTRLNSIIAHEPMLINEKYRSAYTASIPALLFVGSNQPVRISDAKSGLIRRLIDVHPTGDKIPRRRYQQLMDRIEFGLGPIAHHCLSVYLELGPRHYDAYRPTEMMFQTDVFFNFVEAYFDVFSSQEYITVKQAYKLYKEYCDDSGIEKPVPQYKMREELRNYFDEFHKRKMIDGEAMRSVYVGFNADRYKEPLKEGNAFQLVLHDTESLFDEVFASQPAQLAKEDGTPAKKWANVTTTLADIDSSKLHYVKVPEDHVVIDFDLKDEQDEKSLERNLEVASQWPSTYAEVSQSGFGLHLHYVYSGDIDDLATDYAKNIEIKVYRGDSSLRRRVSLCNRVPIARISSGLPLKDKKEKMLKPKTIASEKGLRDLIERNLRKEIHPGTKPSIDFIKKILDDAYESGMSYDVSDLRSRIVAFANNSSNQASLSLKVVKEMKWCSDDATQEGTPADAVVEVTDDRIAFFDVEVYKNLFVVCWKFQGDSPVVKMINPKPSEVEDLFRLKLVGFYNRRYDNHILYAASMGKTPEQLFALSTKLVDNNRNAPYGAAYSLSYADIWDFSSVKQGLKKFEISLGILHMELDLPWDQPVDKKDWDRVVEYCANDVIATEAVFEDRSGDFTARQILAEISGLTVNDTTQQHTAKIIFGNDRNPQRRFSYTDLSETFPGYKFELGKSSYRGEDPGEGGYVYAEPGMYEQVALLDVSSMHPTSIEILNLFGPYTKNFSDLKTARMAIKHGDFESARTMLDGRLAPYLSDESGAEALSYALKIVINIVYGLTSAKFENSFRDHRNVDNIVAKRGALFMIDLKHALQEKGVPVVHIKTDSVKVPLSEGIVEFIVEFGKKYGYDFEHEATYDRLCLVNDAVYVAGINPVPWEEPYPKWQWFAKGAQFQHPFVFKTLFSEEEVGFADFCEARSVVKGSMYLDRSGEPEKDLTKMRHVGRTGLFVPVLEGGGTLYRVHEDKYYAVSGTKGHQWLEADSARAMGDELKIDMSYFEKLRDEAVKAIEQFGSFKEFVSKE